MRQSLSQIANLAEFIAEENITRGKTNLEKIARKNDVAIHYGLFENYFTGMLQHENNTFDIFVNLTKLKNKKYARTRFTIAHELGHYYIDAHRNLLKSGYSLSYDRDLNYFSNDPVEKEANHFATNLLMPPTRFKSEMASYTIGVGAVRAIAKKYNTSLSSTLIQYRNLLDQPCFLVFWESNKNFKRKNFSDSFYNKFKQFSQTFKINDLIKADIFKKFDSFLAPESTSIKGRLSDFFNGITVNSVSDKPVLIETMDLHSYGYASLIVLED